MYLTDLSKSYDQIWIGIGRSRKIDLCFAEKILSQASLLENIKCTLSLSPASFRNTVTHQKIDD